MRRSCMLLISCILFSAHSWSLGTSDLWSLSLEDLINIKVVTASKSSEHESSAPAVMSIVTRDDIESYGANNLHDILRRVAGVNPASGAVLRDNLVSIRGQHSGTIDRRVLILINGRPYRDGHTGGVNTNFYRSFPISSIERIEIIHGPSSILYGSSATSGVINVITRNEAHALVTLTGGSFDTAATEFSGAGKWERLNWNIHGKYLSSDGWPYKSIDFSGAVDEEDYAHEDRAVHFGLAYEGLSFSVFSSEVSERIFDSSLRFFWPTQRYSKHQDLFNLGYKRPLRGEWDLELNLTHNHHDRSTNDGVVDVEAETSLLESTLNGPIADKVNVVLGWTYQRLKGTDFSNADTLAKWDQVWMSAYYQVKYEPLEDLDLTLGQHYNRIDNKTSLGGDKTFSDVSSRLAMGWEIIDPLKLKLLWSEAYRSPYGAELSFQSFLMGNPNLEPEKVESREVQLLYQDKFWRISGSVFRAKYDDEIVIVSASPGPGFTFENQGELDVGGFELEMNYSPLKSLRVSASYSMQKNKTDGVSDDEKRISENMIKFGMAYRPRPGLNVGVFNSYFSEPPAANVSATAVENPGAEAYSHLSINISGNLSVLNDNKALEGLTVSLFGDNLLESDAVYQPDLTATGINTFPARAGRSWYLTFSYEL